MAKFTRAEIRRIVGENCTDEIENALVALHLGVVDPLKDEIDKYKQNEGKPTEADEWKQKYEKEHNDFEEYKKGISEQEAKTAKVNAAKAYFESKNIKGQDLDIAMRGAKEEIDALKLDGNKIKDTAALDELISGTFSRLVSKVTTMGANTATPPNNIGGKDFSSMSLVDKMKYANENPGDQAVKDWLGKK